MYVIVYIYRWHRSIRPAFHVKYIHASVGCPMAIHFRNDYISTASPSRQNGVTRSCLTWQTARCKSPPPLFFYFLDWTARYIEEGAYILFLFRCRDLILFTAHFFCREYRSNFGRVLRPLFIFYVIASLRRYCDCLCVCV